MKVENASLFVNVKVPVKVRAIEVVVLFQVILGENGYTTGGPYTEIELIDYENFKFEGQSIDTGYKSEQFENIRNLYKSLGVDIDEEIDNTAREKVSEKKIERMFKGVRKFLK